MEDEATESFTIKRRFLHAGVKLTDTVATAYRKTDEDLGLTADDKRQVKLRLVDLLQSKNDRHNRRLCVPVNPKPESVYDVAKREAQAKAMRRRSRQPVIDLTGSPEENERTLRRLDAEDERRARSGITDDDDDDEAQDVRRPEDAPGTVDRPIDLTVPAKRKTQRARVAPRKSRKARG